MGLFDDIPVTNPPLKKEAKGSGLFDDIPITNPPAKTKGLFDDIPVTKPPEQKTPPAQPEPAAQQPASGVTRAEVPAGVTNITVRPQHDNYLGRVKDIPGDVKELFNDATKQYKEGKKDVAEALSKDELKKYNEYSDAYKAWAKGGMVGPAPVNETGTGPGKFAKGVFDTVGGLVGAVQSPVMGAFRSMVSQPLEEKGVVNKGLSEAIGNLVMPGVGVFKYGAAAKAAKNAVSEVTTALNHVFNPETVGLGNRAETLMRYATGRAARDTATTRAAFDDYFKTVNQLKPEEQASLIGYIEGRSKGAQLKDPALQPVADTIRDAVQLREKRLKALPSSQQMQFVEDYYTHQWEDPKKAQEFINAWNKGGGRQGSGANLKKRSIPTVADGIAAGLTPKSMNPLETIMEYAANMDKFIAHNAVIDAGRATGDVKYFRNPGVAKQLGLVPLEGRLGVRRTKAGDMQAYAPPEWARVYNNAIGKGWHGIGPTAGNIYDKLQAASNTITGLELGLSGFHLFTMAQEGVVSSLASAAGQAVAGVAALGRGEMKTAAKLLAGSAKDAAVAPISMGVKPYMGHKVQQVYLGRTKGSEHMQKIVDLLEAGGGRAVGKEHASDYKFTAADTYMQAFKKGELLSSLKADASNGPMKFFARQVGRAMAQFNAPLFNHYIPKMKSGAFYENMSAWLNANPTASYSDQIAMAKRIWDSVDNRFGEVVQDNIFWNTMLKQTAQLAMRSYSWNLGTIREIGGGAKKLLTKPTSLSAKGQDYDPKAGYVVALPMGVALVNGIYQYAMTGEMPRDVTDLVAPRTGGMVPGIGGRGKVEERAQLPGYQKDVFGWYDDWYKEMLAKRATLLTSVVELASNRDWKNDPIINPEDSAPEWMKDYFNYVTQKFLPISLKQVQQGEKKGSALGWQGNIGIRPSPSHFTDPKGVERSAKAQGQRIRIKRLKDAQREKRIYGGTVE